MPAVTPLLIVLLSFLTSPTPAKQAPYVWGEGRPDPATVIDSLANHLGKGPVLTQVTGARTYQLTARGLAERRAAAKAYDAIRNSTDDVARIAKTTGRTEAEVAQIKTHVFRQTHRTSKGWQRFDPQIVIAWERMRAGAATSDDLRFLQHELAESTLIARGLSQEAAHETVEAFFRGEMSSSLAAGRSKYSQAQLAELQRLRGIEVAKTTRAGAARPPRHHIFVQKHREWFRARGVDIDDYTLEMTRGEHSAVHSRGWDQRIDEFIDDEALLLGRQYTRRQILAFGAELRREFGLTHIKVRSYGG
jgi:hypothetical protein